MYEHKAIMVDQSCDNWGQYTLDRASEDGWELAAVAYVNGKLTFYFKRPIRE